MPVVILSSPMRSLRVDFVHPTLEDMAPLLSGAVAAGAALAAESVLTPQQAAAVQAKRSAGDPLASLRSAIELANSIVLRVQSGSPNAPDDYADWIEVAGPFGMVPEVLMFVQRLVQEGLAPAIRFPVC